MADQLAPPRERHDDRYALGRTAAEYDRLRAQARVWEGSTGHLFDRIGLAAGASCLDAGCGPGETMRMMAERVGPAGRVLGIDVDASLGADAVAQLHRAGHRQCAFRAHDVITDVPIPGAPFDLVYARLLLFHVPQRVAVLARLWDAVAPGGHLLVQDYDLRAVSVLPALDSAERLMRVMIGAFTTAGADAYTGARLPQLFAQAGVGEPDGTDVAGRLEPLATGGALLERTYRSVLPGALANGIVGELEAAEDLEAFARDVDWCGSRPMLWPLLVAAWKRKR
jgi:ubiquinone/menaquinone biosynthesis C-methylase UbiE